MQFGLFGAPWLPVPARDRVACAAMLAGDDKSPRMC
jgi:hypothetical protein